VRVVVGPAGATTKENDLRSLVFAAAAVLATGLSGVAAGPAVASATGLGDHRAVGQE
jgi:hypothetical protein